MGRYSRGSGWREWVAGGRKVGGATKLEGLLQKSILKEVGGEGGRRGEKGGEGGGGPLVSNLGDRSNAAVQPLNFFPVVVVVEWQRCNADFFLTNFTVN